MTYRVSNRWLLFVFALIFGQGCGEPRLDVYPVSGRVLIKGQPAANAEVIFFGQDEVHQSEMAPFPKASTDANGTFTVTSYESGDGAPAGEYRVTVTCRKSAADDPELREMAPNVVPQEYSDPNESPLLVTIKPEPNQLPDFEIP